MEGQVVKGSEASLSLGVDDCRSLLVRFGPSLALWRAAEIAVLRGRQFEPPVLDLGCGDGIVTSYVLPRVAIGVDPYGPGLEQAARLGIYDHLYAQPVQDLSLPDSSIGTVLSNSVLEHVTDLDTVLEAVHRLLRPRGLLLFTSPTEAFDRWLALPHRGYAAGRNRTLLHHNLWPLDRWRARLAGAGFEIVEVVPYLRRPLVTLWDVLELAQSVWIGRTRLFSLLWQRLPPWALGLPARGLARLDLSAPPPGGGRLIVARKVG